MLADILLRSTIYLRQLNYGTCKSETFLSIKEVYTKQKELRIGSSSWCHQEMSFISKWLYIFALKNRDERNLPLLLHLISALFCSVSQSRVPTLLQRYIIIVI